MNETRRRFLRQSALGFTGVGTAWTFGGLWKATDSSGSLGAFAELLRRQDTLVPPPVAPQAWAPTEPNILGPYFRPQSPFRGITTPPLEPGDVLLVQGRVWALDKRQPLPNAVLDIWHANAAGRYDNDDPQRPPQENEFYCRSRLITDETGYYEYQSIRPGRYKIGPTAWRPSHIHYLVRAAGYADLITQMYFEGDPENARDEFIRPSLIVRPEKVAVGERSYERATFDIVLAPVAR